MRNQRYTLSDLSPRIQSYESGPVMLSPMMQEHIWKVIIADIVAIPFLLIVPRVLEFLAFSGFYVPFGGFPGGLLHMLSGFLSLIAIPLIPVSIVSLLLVAIVYQQSSGLTKPVPIRMHQLAAIAQYPAGAVTVIAGGTTALFMILSVVTVVIWVVLIAIAILLLVVIVSVLSAGLR